MKYTNQGKMDLYKKVVRDYIELIQLYIDMIHAGTLPCKARLTTTKCPILNDVVNANWRSDCYSAASQMYRTELSLSKKRPDKHFSKPVVKQHTAYLDHHLWNIQKSEDGKFDYFVKIVTPYHKSKGRYITFNVPIKFHRVNKYLIEDGFELNKSTMQLSDKNCIKLFWQKEEQEKTTSTKAVAFDCGYNKLIACSDGCVYGEELKSVYEKISRKKRGSKASKRAQIERNYKTNRAVKDFYEDHKDCGVVIVEDLKYVKHRSKYSKKMNNKLQRWKYPMVRDKLNSLSETKGFRVVKVQAAYTSQRCHVCNTVDKSSRVGETYHCKTCGAEMDADINAAINILHLGVYRPQDKES